MGKRESACVGEIGAGENDRRGVCGGGAGTAGMREGKGGSGDRESSTTCPPAPPPLFSSQPLSPPSPPSLSPFQSSPPTPPPPFSCPLPPARSPGAGQPALATVAASSVCNYIKLHITTYNYIYLHISTYNYERPRLGGGGGQQRLLRREVLLHGGGTAAAQAWERMPRGHAMICGRGGRRPAPFLPIPRIVEVPFPHAQ
jgi:hypothetical protein